MISPVKLRITDVVGSSICVSIDDGNRLHEAIIAAVRGPRSVALSFNGVSRLTTAFLNAAVGQLYNEYSEDEVRAFLAPPIEASQEQLGLLKRVVDNAKLFFANQDRSRQVISDTLGDA